MSLQGSATNSDLRSPVLPPIITMACSRNLSARRQQRGKVQKRERG